MIVPWPHLVVVADTNALGARACNTVRAGGREALFRGLAMTGRSRVFVGAHIPAELDRRLPEIATSTGVDLDAAEEALWQQIMIDVSSVPVAIRDCLSPGARTIFQTDKSLPKRLLGDPDDVETLAVAELLAPAVILSADSVFLRFGFSNATADTWVRTAYNLLRVAGFEATVADAAVAADLFGRLAFDGIGSAVHLVRRHPIMTTLLVGIVAFIALRRGWFQRDRFRQVGSWLRAAGEPMVEMIGNAYTNYSEARSTLHVVSPGGEPTMAQVAARYLARRGRPLTPSDLRDELRRRDYTATAKALKAAMDAHPAFVRHPNDLYDIGRPARRARPVIEGTWTQTQPRAVAGNRT